MSRGGTIVTRNQQTSASNQQAAETRAPIVSPKSQQVEQPLQKLQSIGLPHLTDGLHLSNKYLHNHC